MTSSNDIAILGLTKKIEETKEQEKLFRLANDNMNCAYWVLERIKLRGKLFCLLQRDAL